MQVIILGKVLEADILDVVRLVASCRGIGVVDLEPWNDGKTTLKYDGKVITGKTRREACEQFLKAQGLT